MSLDINKVLHKFWFAVKEAKLSYDIREALPSILYTQTTVTSFKFLNSKPEFSHSRLENLNPTGPRDLKADVNQKSQPYTPSRAHAPNLELGKSRSPVTPAGESRSPAGFVVLLCEGTHSDPQLLSQAREDFEKGTRERKTCDIGGGKFRSPVIPLPRRGTRSKIPLPGDLGGEFRSRRIPLQRSGDLCRASGLRRPSL